MQSRRRGIVLMNLGTPDAPTPWAVWRYLRALLDDPRVMPMAAVLRWCLVNLVIAPFRARASARLYQAIWTPAGSPLLVHGRELARRLQERLPMDRVVIGMQCGSPAIARAVAELGNVDEVILLPLYPQNANATVGGAVAMARAALVGVRAPIRVIPPFFAHPAFVAAVASRIAAAGDVDHLLFSFHGLPVAQVPCVDSACELGTSDAARDCYRSQCFSTARHVVAALATMGWDRPWSVAFQSRLGRAEWLGPSTHSRVVALGRSGIKCIGVVCPAFVADCLETLHEIGVEEARAFAASGGESLRLIPCQNADDDWVDALVEIVGAT